MHHLKILDTKRVTWSKFCNDPQISGATEQNWVVWVTWHPGILHPCLGTYQTCDIVNNYSCRRLCSSSTDIVGLWDGIICWIVVLFQLPLGSDEGWNKVTSDTLISGLKLKRVPVDTWSIKEKLCLASAVLRSGDQNWYVDGIDMGDADIFWQA